MMIINANALFYLIFFIYTTDSPVWYRKVFRSNCLLLTVDFRAEIYESLSIWGCLNGSCLETPTHTAINYPSSLINILLNLDCMNHLELLYYPSESLSV